MNFKCPICAYSSESIGFLHVHCIKAHPKEFFTCPWCTIPFESLRALQRHASICSALDKNAPREGNVNEVLVNGDKCLVCEGRFPSFESTIKHYKEQHLHFSYFCDVCEMYFQHNSSLDIHYAMCHPQSSASTERLNSSAMIVSLGENSNQNNNTATAFNGSGGIGVAGPSNTFRENHDRVNVDRAASAKHKRKLMKFARRLHCLDCSIDFANVPEIKNHFLTLHKCEIFFCDDCNNTYTIYSNLSRHAKQCKAKENNNRNNRENAPVVEGTNCGGDEVPTSNVTVNLELFRCHVCDFQTASREHLGMHLFRHCLPMTDHAKLENENEVIMASVSTHVNGIKREYAEDCLTSNNGPRPLPVFTGFLDLTSDDDED